MSDGPIILYDIPNKSKTLKAWSPNTWKVRFALNIKGLNYKTEWVEYPDIKALYEKLNVKPYLYFADGSAYHCLPVIQDPSTNTTMCESFDIIRYLDKTYPDTPALLPKEFVSLSSAFLSAFWPVGIIPMWTVVVAAVCNSLNPRSQEDFKRKREEEEGKKLEDICGEDGWTKLEEGLGKVLKWLDRAEEGSVLFMGDKISFPDIQVVSCLLWAKASLGEDSEGWKKICGWHGGRWKAMHDKLEPYMAVDP